MTTVRTVRTGLYGKKTAELVEIALYFCRTEPRTDGDSYVEHVVKNAKVLVEPDNGVSLELFGFLAEDGSLTDGELLVRTGKMLLAGASAFEKTAERFRRKVECLAALLAGDRGVDVKFGKCLVGEIRGEQWDPIRTEAEIRRREEVESVKKKCRNEADGIRYEKQRTINEITAEHRRKIEAISDEYEKMIRENPPGRKLGAVCRAFNAEIKKLERKLSEKIRKTSAEFDEKRVKIEKKAKREIEKINKSTRFP